MRLPRITSFSTSRLTETVSRATACFVTVTVLLHYLFIDYDDPWRCKALLSGGSWPPRDTLSGWRSEFDKWQPKDCRIWDYTREDFQDCLRGRRVVFIGDSTVRQIFWGTVKRLDHYRSEQEVMQLFVSDNPPQRDITLDVEGVRVVFIWDPWLNSSSLAAELKKFDPTPTPGGDLNDDVNKQSAGLLVIGAPGLWAARNGGEEYFELFTGGIDGVRPYLKHTLHPESRRGVQNNYQDLRNQILLTPVQVPRYVKLSSARAETLTPAKIKRMNKYLADLPTAEASHVITAFNQMTYRVRHSFEDTGLHVREAVADRKTDVVLALRCNAGQVLHRASDKGACCAGYSSPRRAQKVLLATGAVILPVTLWIRRANVGRFARHLPQLRHVKAALALSSVLLFCYVADRTTLFPKAEKRLSAVSISTVLLITCVCSFLSVRRSRVSSQAGKKNAALLKLMIPTATGDHDDREFMPREISDEWKGWMQILLLVFHFQDMSGLVSAYKLTRLFSAAYLFLSAYGHTTYFLKTDDYSLRRVATVIWRLNALSYFVAMVMRTEWTLYYFTTIVTFWFLVTYLTMGVGRSLNHIPMIVAGKTVFMAVLTASLLHREMIWEYFGKVLRYCVDVAYVPNDVRKQIAFDRYTPYLGMVTALLAHRASILKSAVRQFMIQTDRSPHVQARHGSSASSRPARVIRPPRPGKGSSVVDRILWAVLFPDRFSAPVRPVLLIFAPLALLIFFFETLALHRFVDRDSYDPYHPLISWVPILSFALLRNCHRVLRNAHLALPATFGPIALEIYVLRNHVWLSGDGTGLLRLGLFQRKRRAGWTSQVGWRLETVIFTILLLWASRHARRATAQLAAWLFGPPSPRVASSTPQQDEDCDNHGGGERDDLETGSADAGPFRHDSLGAKGALAQGSEDRDDTERPHQPPQYSRGHRHHHHIGGGSQPAVAGRVLSAPRIFLRAVVVLLGAWLSIVYYG